MRPELYWDKVQVSASHRVVGHSLYGDQSVRQNNLPPAYKFIGYKTVLSPAQVAILSIPAGRLFGLVWNKMRQYDATQVSIRDTVASHMSFTSVEQLPAVFTELAIAGLLQTEPHRLSKMTPDEFATIYRYIN
jgi:hypothetical protein